MSVLADPLDLKPTPLEGPALFADYDDNAGDNISGVVCLDGGHCLVVADELIAVQRIRLTPDLGAYTAAETFEDNFRQCFSPGSGDCLEWDLEALARDGNRLFATSSMGFKRKKVRFDPNRWVVAEIAIGADGRPRGEQARVQANIRRLGLLFQGHSPDIASYLDAPLQCGGLNIEGLAHRSGKLYFGLRSPSERDAGRAYIVAAEVSDIFSESGPLRAELHVLGFKNRNGEPVKHIGIRSLEPIGKDFLVVTGAAGVGATKRKRQSRVDRICRAMPGGGYDNIQTDTPIASRIWLWRPGGDPREIGQIAGEYAGRKLEGIGVIARRGGRADPLLTFDDPEELSALAVLKNVSLPD